MTGHYQQKDEDGKEREGRRLVVKDDDDEEPMDQSSFHRLSVLLPSAGPRFTCHPGRDLR